MQAGLLNKIIEIYSCSIEENDFGHIKPNYSFIYRTRARVVYDAGDRTIENDEVFFTNTVTFTVRKYVPVELTSRIKYKDKYYRILSIEDSDYLQNLTIRTELVNE